MSRFLSQRLAALKAYTPGEQPQDKKYIKLNTNESPFPPCDRVREAVEAEIARLNLYSDPEGNVLRRRLAERYGVGPENVFLSNGSDDILNFSFMAFCDEEHGASFPDITYGFYPVYADLYGIRQTQIPLAEDFTLRIGDYLDTPDMVVIANPNAPTGLALSRDEMEQIIAARPDRVVVVDEAYVDFGAQSCVPLVEKYDNLLVVQTFSKARSMAGARLGFAIGHRELIGDLERIKYSTNPYNINRMTLAAGAAAIENDGYYMDNCRIIAHNREVTEQQLRDRGFTVTDSRSNFIFAKPPVGSGEEYYLALKAQGVLVRHFSKERISDYVRITVGTAQQMDALLEKTDIYLKEWRP